MKCPLWFIGRTAVIPREEAGIGDCLMGQCAWWEEHFGKCCIAVEAHLKGVADHRLEVKESQRDRY